MLAAALGTAPEHVEPQVLDLDLGALAGLHAAAAEGAQAGEQLLEGEWLRKVVVCAGVETTHAVVHAVQGREQQHGGVQPLGPHLTADVDAVHLGKHYVEDDHVMGAVERHLEALLAVERGVDGVAFFLQHAADHLRQAAFVFNEQYVHLNPTPECRCPTLRER